MAYVKISYPPGLDRTGTEYQSQGRWYDSDLVRWFMGKLRPIGGWSSLATGYSGTVRMLHSWEDNSSVGRVAVGSNSNIYVTTTGGTKTDITPSSGWSSQAASSTWTLDNAGQLLVAVNDAHGTLYTWTPGDAELTAIEDEAGASGVPTASAVFVTNEGIIVALGADGNPYTVAWSDRDDLSDWSASPTDLAGDLNVQASGGLMAGKNIRGGSLLWSTEALHLMRYIGLPDVYGIEKVADDCGAISRGCMVAVDNMAFWMGRSDFHVWNGFVETIPCPIYDDIFGALNRSYQHTVRACHVSEFNEVWWFLPVGAATEPNKVAVFNYKEGHWAYHDIARTACLGRGHGFDQPLMMTSGGVLYEHETGNTHTGAGTPFARGGPQEIGAGDVTMHVRRFIPDEGTAGDCDVYFYSRLFPNATETEYGPFSSANPAHVRFMGRQVAMKVIQSEATDWKVGAYRVDVVQGGLR